jgi:hypothetical protein
MVFVLMRLSEAASVTPKAGIRRPDLALKGWGWVLYKMRRDIPYPLLKKRSSEVPARRWKE